MIHYEIHPVNPEAHLFEVKLHLDPIEDSSGQKLYMPNWIPGSYMIRDFAKHIQWIKAKTASAEIPLQRLDKSSWLLPQTDEKVVITYHVYAWDLSVRGAHLDQTHGFFNGTCMFLAVNGREDETCSVDISRPSGEAYVHWRLATGLKPVEGTEEFAFGRYQAADYDELIDCPVEMSDFYLISFEACGVPHYMTLTGQHRVDSERLATDLKNICEHHIQFFGEPAPMDRYIFMTYVLGDGFGGLEHRNSTALHCSRKDLPLEADDKDSVKDDYQTFLDLCSHEYFHTWNVKRIKPAEFLPYDTQNESYTELLWAFEGITSYYDNLALAQTETISPDEYLTRLAKTITSVRRSKGRYIQTVTDSSFDAWTKFYKQDENAPNAVVSYYTKGAEVALCLDLLIRQATQWDKSLKDIMRRLWLEYGSVQKGVENDTIKSLVLEEVPQSAHQDMKSFFDTALYSTDSLPTESLLKQVGLELRILPRVERNDRGSFKKVMPENKSLADLGIEYTKKATGVRVKNVYADGAAGKAGISADDQLIALNGLMISADSFDGQIQQVPVGETVSIMAFRRDELMEFEVVLEPAECDTAYITYAENFDDNKTRFNAWLKIHNPGT
ncbi:M61 family metallopeptidase [Kangiella sediminilitoris]|uniref:Peptidase M61 domain protein n=1 Tax=Kangiella sediminilitoris TaxID=1144748 RepID=A0A1B3B9R0_9GAMM|nr:PDZ domain-containing protein [Kangiella sediminilitoris]AOE49539.1 Peptidase M61 domain protein [Kangiella sediminilitoris]